MHILYIGQIKISFYYMEILIYEHRKKGKKKLKKGQRNVQEDLGVHKYSVVLFVPM